MFVIVYRKPYYWPHNCTNTVYYSGVHSGYSRQAKKPTDSLYVMANHGQLLEYTLDPQPDPTIPKDKVCESSPIELNIVAYGQWNLGRLSGRDRSVPLIGHRDNVTINNVVSDPRSALL